MELIENCIVVLDVLHWVNKTFKAKKDQIETKEFYNDAINNNLRLKNAMAEWAKQSKIQIRNGLKISHGTTFNICSYHWIFNPHLKTQMLHTYQELDWKFYSNVFLMQAFFTRAREDPTKFHLNVPRDNIIEASMDLIVKTNAKDFGGHDPLKKPISI